MGQKGLQKRVSKPKSDVFGMPRPTKSNVRVSKIKVLGVPKKNENLSKMKPQKGSQFIYLGHFGGPWEARG